MNRLQFRRWAVAMTTAALVLNTPGVSQAFLCNCFKKWCARVGYYQPTYTAAYAPCAGTVCQYVPITAYRQAVVNVPVTTYRPVCSADPQSGCPTTCLRPEVSYRPAIQAVPYTTYRLVYSNPIVAAPIPTVRYCAPCGGCTYTATSYAAPTYASTPGCCGATGVTSAYPPSDSHVVVNSPAPLGYPAVPPQSSTTPSAPVYAPPVGNYASPATGTYASPATGTYAPPAAGTYAPPAAGTYAPPGGSYVPQGTGTDGAARYSPLPATPAPTDGTSANEATPAPGNYSPLPGTGAAHGAAGGSDAGFGAPTPTPALRPLQPNTPGSPAGALQPFPETTSPQPAEGSGAGPRLNDPGARTTWNADPRGGAPSATARRPVVHRSVTGWVAPTGAVSRPFVAAPTPTTSADGWRVSTR